MKTVARRLGLIAAAIALTLVVGTVGFTVIEGYAPFDAFYMTLITVSTVGYAEVHPLSHGGRVFNSFVIFFGVTTMFFAIGAMTRITSSSAATDAWDAMPRQNCSGPRSPS